MKDSVIARGTIFLHSALSLSCLLLLFMLIDLHKNLTQILFLQLVELKNGETYNGHMVQCDSWMNVHIKEVICTSKVSPANFTIAACALFSSKATHLFCSLGPLKHFQFKATQYIACGLSRKVTGSGGCQRHILGATLSNI